MKEESTPMTTLFEYIEDGSKLHNIVSMRSLFMQYERVWLAKHITQVSDSDRADIITHDIYKNDK